MKKGVITVFLSLILTLILSLVSAVIESVRVSAIRARIEMCADMGLFSVFAEYNRELLKNYDLYFIDTSYGSSKPSLANTSEHLKDYLRYNMDPAKGQLTLGTVDLTGLSVKKAVVEMPSYASDNGGRVFKRQAIHSVKDRFGLSLISKAADNYKAYKNSGIEGSDVDTRREKLKEKLDGIDWKGNTNPADEILDQRAGVLNLIMNKLPQVSDKAIKISELASHRKLTQGIGVVKPDSDPDSITNELLFNEYLVWKCSSYTKDLKHSSMAYELEYILNGKNTDKANLRKTVEKLLAVRVTSDTITALKSQDFKSQTDAVGEALAVLLLNPELAEPISELLLFAWGFAEGVIDVRALLKGEKVAVVKPEQEFNIKTVAQLPLFMTMSGSGSKDALALSYADYLRIFLMMEDKTAKTMRAMDVIEANIRTTDGNPSFRMDGCVEYLQADIEVDSRYGYSYDIRREFSYEPVTE